MPTTRCALRCCRRRRSVSRREPPRPDVIHAHDWQAGLAVLRAARPSGYAARDGVYRSQPDVPRTVSRCPRRRVCATELLTPTGSVLRSASFIKAGLQLADRLTTVSPRYAQEICTPEFGYGLDGVMQARRGRLTGILNGVDYDRWSPWLDGSRCRFASVVRPPSWRRCRKMRSRQSWLAKARCRQSFSASCLPVRPKTPLLLLRSRG